MWRRSWTGSATDRRAILLLDPPPWIADAAAEFLHELFRASAFQGSRPNEAYFVSCDAETTSEADVEAGRVHVVVGFSALRPAEFQVLDVELARPDIATSSG